MEMGKRHRNYLKSALLAGIDHRFSKNSAHDLYLFVICLENTYLQNPIIGISTDRSCRRPPGCVLDCPFGYQTGLLGICLCICADIPCFLKACAPNEYCQRNSDGTAFCVSQIDFAFEFIVMTEHRIEWEEIKITSQSSGNRIAVKPGECPHFFDRTCIYQCNSDSDCGSTLKCCSNGCGRECVVALSPQLLPVNSFSIHPLQTTGHSNRIGKCPPRSYIKNQNCVTECIYDEECPSIEKCCDSDCGSVCTPPEKATDCIHLITAISRLPGKTLINGYVPKCTIDGQFENIQCDDSFCWCVDEKGIEIFGTKTARKIGQPNCIQRRDCEAKLCPKICHFGIKTDDEGCPLDNCKCRDLCEEVKCVGDIEICQMVEPDCAKSPCQPIPKCLLNPCPNGSPMTLSNGVTALCTHTNQCSPYHWCHQIGFNGFGFCCSLPKSILHSGSCVPVLSLSSKSSKSECRVDSDCSEQAKCCFNGSSLKCMFDSTHIHGFHVDSSTQKLIIVEEQLMAKGTKVQQIGKCPKISQHHDLGKCAIKCKIDQDCGGIKKCCTYNCSAICLYPTEVTACLHEVITHEIFGYGRAPKCNDKGNYEQIQCDDNICYCVDTLNGNEIPATRTALQTKPVCNERRLDCEPFMCSKVCAYGFEITSKGCPLCECRNPCKNKLCPHGYICVMANVKCSANVYCPNQPRCVPNVCATNNLSMVPPILCDNKQDCPNDYWCNNIGIQSKGLCCPIPSKELHGEIKCKSMEPFIENNKSCDIRCRGDDECVVGAKCCYDGCGTICVQISAKTSYRTKVSELSECPRLNNNPPDCRKNEIDDCIEDVDCYMAQKCCSNGCKKACMYPEVTTACIHLLGASQTFEPGSFVPQCDTFGDFTRIQKLGALFWCVDAAGRELSGTRTSHPYLNCNLPRSCPLLNCQLNCSSGYEKNHNGCDQCRCRDPCKNVRCPSSHVCSLIDVKCILNACPKGEPLTLPNMRDLVLCNTKEDRHCPLEVSSAICPITFELRPPDSKQCKIRCHTHNDCSSGKCCFNGCGTSCMGLRAEEIVRNTGLSFPKNVFSRESHEEFEKLGNCSIDFTSNSNCKIDCTKDSDCPGFQKCCAKGCSSSCAFPQITTACIHKLASYNNENKMISSNGPRIECNEDGIFKKIQCDQQRRQCWCVNTETGEEMLGTRVMAANAKPNCQTPIVCSTVCDQIKCEHGPRLDINGCPLNDFCECKNPCEEIKCARKEDVCVLIPVICVTSPCPSVPQCKSNPCLKPSEALRDRNNNVFSCVQNEDCGRGSCRLLLNEQKHGICCSSDCNVECSNDSACPGVQLCCDYGCNKICIIPEVATNCILLHAAISKLIDSGATVNLRIPWCNKHTGMFETVQCNDFNNCWCVNAVTGTAIHGSRMKFLDSSLTFAYDVCSYKKRCPVSCNDAICPVGFEMDANNCPKDIHCHCRNLCDAIQCSGDKICMLRRKICSESTCIPVPSCEANPCSDSSRPALDETTYIQLSCSKNRTEMCPPGYYCTGYDAVMQGVCCPKIKTKEARQHTVSCPHGNPFSNKVDGWPVNCTQSGNDCPSTHYCFSASDQSFGVCCVSKRYVCRLPLDAGACAVNLKRYYYDYTNKTCIPFNYSGCSGNLNNFINKKDCEKFCLDIPVDLNGTEKIFETYQLGFSLTGPLFREKHQQDINEAFRDYLMKRFDVGDDELKDIVIHDDNMVQFVLRSEDAELKATNISSVSLKISYNQISDGSFRFLYNGDIYRAEPHSWISHRIVEKKRFIYKKTKESETSSGVISTSQYAARIDYATPTVTANTPKSDTSTEHFEKLMSSENGHHCRYTTNKGSDEYEVHTTLQRPSRRQRCHTTVYY
ncbi:unnamed protein product [Onchocerca ochengi]|uniref:Thyroglobulin type-1 domain-containing protein n=1 Tax=Onchocerca ochengi TaxID=42157 RepID=A0A182DYL3_ONCOC|nr:unnamed protein product [Onchocerca ochengi]